MSTFETYIGYCCREYILARNFYGIAFKPMACVHCGERPTYLREDDYDWRARKKGA